MPELRRSALLLDLAVTRGDAEGQNVSVFYFKQDQLVAIDSINCPADHMVGRKLLAVGVSLTPQQAVNSGFDLKSLVLPRLNFRSYQKPRICT